MRIYSKKTYIVIGAQGGAHIIDGEELRRQIATGGYLFDGDSVYEAQLFAIAKERKEMYLVDASGQEQVVETGGTDEQPPA